MYGKRRAFEWETSMTAQPQPPHKSTLLREYSRLYYSPIPPILFSTPYPVQRKAMTNTKTFQINFYYISSTSVRVNLIRIFVGLFLLLSPLGVLLLPWNNLYMVDAVGVERANKKNKVRSFIYDNKQNSKRLEYKWMSVKCFDQPRKKKREKPNKE